MFALRKSEWPGSGTDAGDLTSSPRGLVVHLRRRGRRQAEVGGSSGTSSPERPKSERASRIGQTQIEQEQLKLSLNLMLNV